MTGSRDTLLKPDLDKMKPFLYFNFNIFMLWSIVEVNKIHIVIDAVGGKLWLDSIDTTDDRSIRTDGMYFILGKSKDLFDPRTNRNSASWIARCYPFKILLNVFVRYFKLYDMFTYIHCCIKLGSSSGDLINKAQPRRII